MNQHHGRNEEQEAPMGRTCENEQCTGQRELDFVATRIRPLHICRKTDKWS